jgi:hypothetical protein
MEDVRDWKLGILEEEGTCVGRKEGGDVIGRWRVFEMNGRDGYELKIADRLRSEFQIF